MSLVMRTRSLLFALAALLAAASTAPAVDVSDPAGDTQGPDLTRLNCRVTGGAMEIRLTFAQDLEGAFGDMSAIVNIDFDMDRSLLTGFTGGPGWHPRHGIDYRVELSLSGFGASYSWAFLKYWQHTYDEPFITVNNAMVALGDWFDPNGSVLVVGTDTAWGTDNHQALIRIPLDLFNNAAFPVCAEGLSFCYNTLFPCPLGVAQDPARALVRATADPSIPSETILTDSIPDHGMLSLETGAVVPEFSTSATDLLLQATDPDNDAPGSVWLNGEEITGLKIYRHEGGILAFDMSLAGLNLANTAVFHVVFDLDDNPATGESYNHAGTPMGVDLIAMLAMHDNPVGEPNPLQGNLLFWVPGGYCTLPDYDFLGTAAGGMPGRVVLGLPPEVLAPGLAANTSGRIKLIAGTSAQGPLFMGFDDVIPNNSVLSIPVRAATPGSPRVTKFEKRTGGRYALRYAVPAGFVFSRIDSSSAVTGPWTPETGLAPVLVDGGDYEVLLDPGTAPRRFYQVLVAPAGP